MSEVNTVSPVDAQATAPELRPKRIEDAATQFESMLIQQMLRSAREADGEKTEGSGGNTMLDYAEQSLSQVLAQNGGLGIGAMLVRGLTVREVNDARSDSGTRHNSVPADRKTAPGSPAGSPDDASPTKGLSRATASATIRRHGN